MKAAFIIIFATVLMISPMYMGVAHGHSDGQIQFDKSPTFNLTIGNQKISLDLFSPQYLDSNFKKITSNPIINTSGFMNSDMGKNINLSFGKAIRESYHETVNGKLNISYSYFLQERVFEISMPGILAESSGNFLPLNYGYLFINMTINVFETRYNNTITGLNGNIFVGSNNSLRITYEMNVHSTLGGTYHIIIPTVFSSSSNGIGVENFTGARMTERNQFYSGIRLHIDQDRNIYFLYNGTYYMDGMAREMKTLNYGPNGSNLNALSYVFTGNGKYSNISYDPYLSIPGQNILKNITVKDIENGVVNLILENSVYLSIGLVVGMVMIGSGYVYRRKKP
ncbi:MAG: hypothetical protein B2I18_02740 [Cuniculiplasma sp. C_DKE]|nr:MAG: hypothetical protein B2I18_02740 [Cuniculiplasma sp. C_DKE]